jgi:hypothetical protein
VAKSPDDHAAAESFLENTRQYQVYLTARQEEEKRDRAAAVASQAGPSEEPALSQNETPKGTGAEPPLLRHRDAHPRGARDLIQGRIKSVRCSGVEMDMTLQASHKALKFHAENYFKVDYRALDFKPTGELQPCTELEGRAARIVFFPFRDDPDTGELVSVDLLK